MKFSGAVFGTERVKKMLSGAADIVGDAMVKAVQQSTLAVHSAAVKSLQSKSLGHQEVRYGPKRLVVVSKPGDPPNTDTGDLVKSIQFEFDKGGTVGYVGTNMKYGAWLEFGTESMSARPWLGPALSIASQKVTDAIQKNINDGIAKAFGVKNAVKSVKDIGKDIKRGTRSVSKTVKKAKKAAKKAIKGAKRKARK